jgi:hypothetical protein
MIAAALINVRPARVFPPDATFVDDSARASL